MCMCCWSSDSSPPQMIGNVSLPISSPHFHSPHPHHPEERAFTMDNSMCKLSYYMSEGYFLCWQLWFNWHSSDSFWIWTRACFFFFFPDFVFVKSWKGKQIGNEVEFLLVPVFPFIPNNSSFCLHSSLFAVLLSGNMKMWVTLPWPQPGWGQSNRFSRVKLIQKINREIVLVDIGWNPYSRNGEGRERCGPSKCQLLSKDIEGRPDRRSGEGQGTDPLQATDRCSTRGRKVVGS